MSESPVVDKPGLRERKKAKTRAAIQEQALRLFREQGYDGTTVEQIAEAAEVSPSTFFRYFGTKEEVVAYDALDPIVMLAWRSQPADMPPIAAIRKAMVEVFGSLTPGQIEELMNRGRILNLGRRPSASCSVPCRWSPRSCQCDLPGPRTTSSSECSRAHSWAP